ncbi:MAG: DUF4145 domain-containing protein [Smithella sp.]|jgi:hypothetical protein
MKLHQWISFLLVCAAVIVHGFFPNLFTLDATSAALLLLLAIPLIAPFLKQAKILGAELVFSDEIRKVEHLVEQSEAEAREKVIEGEEAPNDFEDFSTSVAREMLEVDPNLALAAIRIEIERVLSAATEVLLKPSNLRRRGIRTYSELLENEGFITESQREALLQISNICNGAIHGAPVSVFEAEEVIELTERLNNSFPIGYSIRVYPNYCFQDQGLSCEYEHCIEHFPIQEENGGGSCPLFGHDCPGGAAQVAFCKNQRGL